MITAVMALAICFGIPLLAAVTLVAVLHIQDCVVGWRQRRWLWKQINDSLLG